MVSAFEFCCFPSQPLQCLKSFIFRQLMQFQWKECAVYIEPHNMQTAHRGFSFYLMCHKIKVNVKMMWQVAHKVISQSKKLLSITQIHTHTHEVEAISVSKIKLLSYAVLHEINTFRWLLLRMRYSIWEIKRTHNSPT